MAASLQFFSLTPQALSLHHSSSSCSFAVSGVSTLFVPSSLKPLPKLVLSVSSLNNYAFPTSRLVRNVAVSSELDEALGDGDEDGLDSSDSDESNFSPDLKLFVGNLPFSVDSAGLAGLFEQVGTVEMVEVIYDKTSGRSRGFGFVTMSSKEEAKAAEQQLDGYELQGRALRVNSGPPPPKGEFRGSRGRDRTGSTSTNRLYVGNLSWNVDTDALEALFSEQGNVTEARVVYDRESGRSRGFGFVSFGSAEEANNAAEALNGVEVDGRSIRVSPAEDRPPRQY